VPAGPARHLNYLPCLKNTRTPRRGQHWPEQSTIALPTSTALITVLKCRGFDHLVRSEVAPLSAPRKSPNNRHPQAPIRHPDLERVARNLSEAPGPRPGLTHIVGPRLPHGPARLLAALVTTAALLPLYHLLACVFREPWYRCPLSRCNGRSEAGLEHPR
jgi:hypothetical protein